MRLFSGAWVGDLDSLPAANSCDPEEAMKLLLGILVALIVAGSFFADYKWRQWMAARRRDRQQ
jgi:hypothetical protein